MSGSVTGAEYIGKKHVLMLLQEARELIPFYDRENRKHPEWHHDYGTVDDVALHLLESREGVIITGIKLNGEKITLSAQEGLANSKGELLYVGSGTKTYFLDGFKESTTVARFANSISQVMDRRANSKTDLSTICTGNMSGHARRTQKALQPLI